MVRLLEHTAALENVSIAGFTTDWLQTEADQPSSTSALPIGAGIGASGSTLVICYYARPVTENVINYSSGR